MSKNRLYFGDNLDVLRRHVGDESVDLVYLDPPFNSKADYNVLFREDDGTMAESQIQAFKDTWHWSEAAAAYEDFVLNAPHRASLALQAFRSLLGCNDMLAYLTMMAPRLVELRRVLKPNGSLYLHCDQTAGHYLKILLDSIFGNEFFRNEVVWKRTHAHNASRRFGPISDAIYFYTKSHQYTWNFPVAVHGEEYVSKKFTYKDPGSDRLFQPITLTGSGVRQGDSGKPWRGTDPTPSGRHWALPGSVLARHGISTGSVQDKLDALDAAGMIYWPRKDGGSPRLKHYLDETLGSVLSNVWTDIPPINSQAQERLGYPTQKPEALLSRILEASSVEGDTILDPFCGCGTTISVAQRLNRKWVGIDITALATTLIKKRLRDAYGPEVVPTYDVFGEPTTLAEAERLAKVDRYQFQFWALGLVDARPAQADEKKGSDKGIDGRLKFHDEPESGKVKQVIFSVKSGHLKNEFVRELPHILDREKAQIGVLITLEKPTKPMKDDAASAGFYHSPWGTQHRRVQILTVEELLEGKQVDLPPSRDVRTFKTAPKAKKSRKKDTLLPFDEADES